MDDLYYYDDYDGGAILDENDVEDYESGILFPPTAQLEQQTLIEIYVECIKPSVSQIINPLSLIAFSLLCSILWNVAQRKWSGKIWLQHVISMLCGFVALFVTTGLESLIAIFLSLLAYITLLILEYRKISKLGCYTAAITITTCFIFECMWHKPEAYQRIRGIQMIATMKIISLAYDLEDISAKKDNKIIRAPALIPFLSYIFCPATCVLGPWISYATYNRYLRNVEFKKRYLIKSALYALYCIAFLCLSNCLVPAIYMSTTFNWLIAFKSALSVRCSHYFICSLSESSFIASGLDSRTESKMKMLTRSIVTKPLNIEFPRSLSTVVRSWNIPMHEWLKTYIFRRIQGSDWGNYIIAVMGTYLLSALLHGLDMRIYLVLLSLGSFAYIENILRHKLASIFNACISSTNPCSSGHSRKPCQYANCSTITANGKFWTLNSFLVRFVNLFFSLVNLFQLAYLGVLMDMDNMNTMDVDDDNNGTNGSVLLHLKNAHEIWSGLGYLGHWIALLMLIFYYLI